MIVQPKLPVNSVYGTTAVKERRKTVSAVFRRSCLLRSTHTVYRIAPTLLQLCRRNLHAVCGSKVQSLPDLTNATQRRNLHAVRGDWDKKYYYRKEKGGSSRLKSGVSTA